MDKKETDKAISKEDIELFRRSLKNIQPIKHDKVSIRKKPLSPFKKRSEFSDQIPGMSLSDHETEAPVNATDCLFFARDGVSPKQLQQLKKGKIPFAAVLDLHGHDTDSARTELIHFITGAHKKNYRCLCIIHGKGHFGKPVLKNKINSWLRQIDKVLAFSSAQPQHGGTGAVYVLLRSANKERHSL